MTGDTQKQLLVSNVDRCVMFLKGKLPNLQSFHNSLVVVLLDPFWGMRARRPTCLLPLKLNLIVSLYLWVSEQQGCESSKIFFAPTSSSV